MGIELVVFLLLGCVIGIISGLLGVGGGTVVVPTVVFFLVSIGVDPDLADVEKPGPVRGDLHRGSSSAGRLVRFARGAVGTKRTHRRDGFVYLLLVVDPVRGQPVAERVDCDRGLGDRIQIAIRVWVPGG